MGLNQTPELLEMTSFLIIWFLWFIGFADGRLAYFEFEPMHPNATELSKLMNNRHIVIVGDSLLRYQYLSLVYLVHYSTFYSNDERPNMVMEHSFSGVRKWVDFFEFSNQLFYPFEHCDCFRTAGPYAPPKGSDVYENRYYRNDARNITISYLQYFGDQSMFSGHWRPSDSNGTAPYQAPDLKMTTPKWIYHKVEDVLIHIAAKLQPKPTTLILNAGAHPHNYLKAEHRTRVFTTAKSLFDRIIWKTSSPRVDHSAVSTADTLVCAHREVECLNLNWTFHLSPRDYADKLHFFSRGYSDIDVQLIRQLVTRKPVVYSLLDPAYRGSILEVANANGTATSHYFVDTTGLLRCFNLTGSTNAACALALKKLPLHSVEKEDFLRYLVGDPVEDICPTVQNL